MSSRLILENVISDNRIEKIRIVNKGDRVIGGQPSDDDNSDFVTSESARDLACTIKFALDELDKIRSAYVKDTLWDRMLSGVIYQTILNSPPEPNILFLNGSVFDKSKYPKLAILYPTGILPDLQERYLIGASDDMPVRTKIAQALMKHTHAASAGSDGSHAHSGWVDGQGEHGHSAWTDQQGWHNHSFPLTDNELGGGYGQATQGIGIIGSGWVDGAGSHAHNVGIGAAGHHGHNVGISAVGSHIHSITISDTGVGKQLVDSYAINYMIKGE